MMLSDISIRRPVFATVMSLLIIVLGVMAFSRLTLRELPAIDPPIVSASVSYPGASAAVVETRVTQVLEDALSGIEGVNTIESRSQQGRASVSIEFSLSRDIEAAANDVRGAISRVAGRLPEETDPPQISKVESDSDPILWLNMSSTNMDSLHLTDYADRYIVDRLSSIDGVASVMIGGQQRYAMRVWLNRDQMAARGITISDVSAALRAENVELPAGQIESAERDFAIRVERNYRSAEDFSQMPLKKGDDGYVVRLGDVAKVELTTAERRAYYKSNGEPNIGIGIVKTSTANSLDVARAARDAAEQIQPTLPPGMKIFVAFDTTQFIEAAVERVYWTLGEAIVLVLIVIWLFLGSWRAALIPAVTVPICLIAAFIPLYVFGFSINLLTLLALILCIGLVVDDAIVVLENIQRRADLGEPRLLAATRGTKQVAFAVIATTAVLVAVFLPVGFMEGNTGRLFRELSVAMAGAVAISALIALTLTPMMSSKLVRPHSEEKSIWIVRQFNKGVDWITKKYTAILCRVISHAWLFGIAMLLAFSAVWGLMKIVPSELAPAEDRGSFSVVLNAPEGAGFDYTVKQVQEAEHILAKYTGPDKDIVRYNPRVPGGFGGGGGDMSVGRIMVFLNSWRDREKSTQDVADSLRKELSGLRGVQARPQVGGGLVRTRGQPLQLVLQGPDYAQLTQWRDVILDRLKDNPNIVGPDSDYKETLPQLRVAVDPKRAADLGVSQSAIGQALEAMLGGQRVTTFVQSGEEYDVILQAMRDERLQPSDLEQIQVRSKTGQMIPLSNLVTMRNTAEPMTFNRFNRLRAITISASLAPGYPMGQAVNDLNELVREVLPPQAQIDWKGESREFNAAGSTVMITFALALLIVYLVLAAQFESFVHPFVIMLTVPLGVLGALIGLWLSGGSLNLFSQIGIVMLVGLAAKNGILIVEFANQLRDEGRTILQAIIESSTVRLRPILMTSIATAVGAVPLILAGGPGSASRQTIGIVIVFGVAFSTLLSLFVVPVFYNLLARFTKSPQTITKEIDRLEINTAPVDTINAPMTEP